MSELLEAPAATDVNPFSDLVPSDTGAFDDLLPDQFTIGAKQAGQDYGEFADLVPLSPTSESERALAETPKQSTLVKLEKGVENLSGLPIHQVMNATRVFGSAAGKYIFQGLQGLEIETAKVLKNPPSELTTPQAEAVLLPQEEQDALEQKYIAETQAAIPDALARAEYWKGRAEGADEQSEVDPALAQTIPARLSAVAGEATMMGMEALVPGVGLPLMVMHGALATEAEALNHGQTPAQAEAAAVRSAIGLAIFGGASKVAALGVAKLLPKAITDPNKLTKFMAQFVGQEAANESSSRVIAAWNAASDAPIGEKVEHALQALKETTLEQSALNTAFALIGASKAAGAKGVTRLESQDPAIAARLAEGRAVRPASEPEAVPASERGMPAETQRYAPTAEIPPAPEQTTVSGQTQVYDKSVKEQFQDSGGTVDLPAATSYLGQVVKDALSRGEGVNLVADFGRKTVPIVKVRDSQLIDAKGQQWGTFDVFTGGSKIEITRKAPSVPSTPLAATEGGLPPKTEPIGITAAIAEIQRRNAPEPVLGDVWYQGVGPDGAPTSWVTSNLEKAKIYASRRGNGTINVFTPDQVGETAFADSAGNLISPREYAKTQSQDTTIQTLSSGDRPGAAGSELPKPIQVLSADGKPISPLPAEASTANAAAPAEPKRSKIGQSIEAKAVEAKLTEGFAETALYDPITIADQAQRATGLVKSSINDARAVIRGEAPLPEGLRGTSLITAMEEHLSRKPDAQVAYELANSPLTSATSAAAQEMRLMSERVPDGITAKFQEIREARKAGSKQRGETSERVVQDIQREMVRNASKRPTWEAFVKEITC